MKMNCFYCSEITICSCPDHESEKYKDARHTCEVCLHLMEIGVKEDELKTSDKREGAKNFLLSDLMSNIFSDMLVDDIFKDFWAEEKKILKELSKKDLANESFYSGMLAAFNFCFMKYSEGELDQIIETMKEQLKKEE